VLALSRKSDKWTGARHDRPPASIGDRHFPGEIDPAVLMEFTYKTVGEGPPGRLGVKNADIGAGQNCPDNMHRRASIDEIVDD
jgi:hypothetical protein